MTKPSKPSKPQEPLPNPEEVLRRMLGTPPEPFTPPKEEPKKKPSK